MKNSIIKIISQFNLCYFSLQATDISYYSTRDKIIANKTKCLEKVTFLSFKLSIQKLNYKILIDIYDFEGVYQRKYRQTHIILICFY